ncbi:MAG: cation acetate symporter, partial [Planctomycetota bacterium]
PLLGFPHWVGVVLVGIVVITIVVTAGMVSTTWVQFLKGSLLVVFSTVLVALLLARGFVAEPDRYERLGPFDESSFSKELIGGQAPLVADDGWELHPDLYRFPDPKGDGFEVYQRQTTDDGIFLMRAQCVTKSEGRTLIDGAPLGNRLGEKSLAPVGTLSRLPGDAAETGSLGPISFLTILGDSEVVLWRKRTVKHDDGSTSTVFVQKLTPGSEVLRPGEHPKFAGIRKPELLGKLNFLSLMLALFCGTASLPHILIRYYTVKDGAAARKSTIVGIASIGFFYVLTLYIGLGAMTSGAMDLTDSNMAAPLLARSMNNWLFAIISAIAFTTVLGTVSGLILASSGAVAHDLLVGVFRVSLSEAKKVRVAKIAAVVVGLFAIVLGILFKELNVGYLVGWAFSVAASANLPALVMLLFWPRTTRQGIIASVVVGMFSSLGWILLSADTFKSVYGLDAERAPVPFSQPGIVTIPLAFLTLVVVSLATPKKP